MKSNKAKKLTVHYSTCMYEYIFFKVILNIEKIAFWTARRGESLRRRAIVFLIPILKVNTSMKPFFSGRVKLYLTYSMPNILCRVELHLNWFSETCSVILSECNFSQRKLPELGTRQHCRDSVTMFSGHKIISHCLYSFGRRYLNFLPCCRCHEAIAACPQLWKLHRNVFSLAQDSAIFNTIIWKLVCTLYSMYSWPSW